MALISVSKTNGKLQLKELKPGWETRNQCVMDLIKWSDEKYNFKNFKEITIHTGDCPHSSATYSCTVTINEKKANWDCFPDFCFVNWPVVHIDDYRETCKELNTQVNLDNYDELKIGWIGNVFNNHKPRNILHKLGLENPNLLDIRNIDTRTYGINSKLKLPSCYQGKHNFMTFLELANKYAFLLDVQGGGYSGRLKFLLHTGRPVFIIARQYQEFFFEYLKENYHYIPVKEDCVDLLEKINWAINNYEEAKQIGLNGKQFAQTYLTRDYALHQINEMINKL